MDSAWIVKHELGIDQVILSVRVHILTKIAGLEGWGRCFNPPTPPSIRTLQMGKHVNKLLVFCRIIIQNWYQSTKWEWMTSLEIQLFKSFLDYENMLWYFPQIIPNSSLPVFRCLVKWKCSFMTFKLKSKYILHNLFILLQGHDMRRSVNLNYGEQFMYRDRVMILKMRDYQNHTLDNASYRRVLENDRVSSEQWNFTLFQ